MRDSRTHPRPAAEVTTTAWRSPRSCSGSTKQHQQGLCATKVLRVEHLEHKLLSEQLRDLDAAVLPPHRRPTRP